MSLNPAVDANETMAKLLALENRTGYTMQQFNGQRKFWNPKWDKPIPPRGCEVFVGKIPRNLFEDELVPVFEKIGQIFELRLMMDFSGYNRGYAFVCFTTREHAQMAISRLDNYEIRPGMRIGVCRSVDNCRLFVGGIPKDKSQLEIRQAMCEISEDVSDVIVYPGSEPGEQNRGFAFVEYRTHRAAAMARRKLIPGRITLFGNEIVTDWAEPEIDANESLNRIKNVYVRNLKITTTEQTVFAAFNVLRPGAIERVKKIEDRDYAFVHFLQREDALYAVQVMNGQKIDGQEVQVSLAKPPSNKHDTNNSMLQNANQSNSYNQPATFGRINGVMMTRPSPQIQSQQMPNPFPFPPPSTPTTSDYANLIRAQTAAKLQQSLQCLQPPPIPPSYQVPPPKLSPPSQYPLLSVTKSDSLFGSVSKPVDCTSNGKNYSPNERESKDLIPVSTLDHIAKIQCPVVYLDEISTMFNNGIRPVYALFSDNSLGRTRYVYRITFMGECYTPSANRYCYSVPEAQKVAAEYVLKQIDPWLKKKITEVVQNSSGMKPLPISSSRQSLPSPVATTNNTAYNRGSLWGSSLVGKVNNYDTLLNRTCGMQNANKKPLYPVKSSLLGSFSPKNTSVTSSSAYGLPNNYWDQLKQPDSYNSSISQFKESQSLPSFSSLTSDLLSSSLMADSLGGFSRANPSFDRVISPCNALQALSIDG